MQCHKGEGCNSSEEAGFISVSSLESQALQLADETLPEKEVAPFEVVVGKHSSVAWMILSSKSEKEICGLTSKCRSAALLLIRSKARR